MTTESQTEPAAPTVAEAREAKAWAAYAQAVMTFWNDAKRGPSTWLQTTEAARTELRDAILATERERERVIRQGYVDATATIENEFRAYREHIEEFITNARADERTTVAAEVNHAYETGHADGVDTGERGVAARYAAIIDFMEWDDVSHWPGCSGDLGYPCKCGATEARAALAALKEA